MFFLPFRGRARAIFLTFLSLSACTFCAAGEWPRTVRDAWGYDLKLKTAPVSIVSLTLATDEILVDLIDHQRIRALELFSADPGISNIAAFAKTFPVKVSGEKEQIIILKPDLVLVADWKDRDFVQSLRDAGLQVFVFRAPLDFADLTRSIRELGTLCGAERQASTMIDGLQKRLKLVHDKVAALAGGKKLSVLSYTFYGGTYGKGTSLDSIVQAAGLINVASAAGLEAWPQLSREQVLAMNPDIILLPSWSYDGKSDSLRFRDEFLRDPIFSSLKAVRTKRVLIIPDTHLQSNSQYMVDAVEDLAHAAYPELFR